MPDDEIPEAIRCQTEAMLNGQRFLMRHDDDTADENLVPSEEPKTSGPGAALTAPDLDTA